MHRSLLFFLASALWCTGCSSDGKQIIVSNTSDSVRDELISIPYTEFTQHFGVDSTFSVKKAGAELPYQLVRGESNNIQQVLIRVSVDPHGETALMISDRDDLPQFEPQTFARYVPERKDDFAWENDVVAFRAYGKALEGTSEDAQGFDFWAKRTDELVIDKWYQSGDYHADHGKGLDYYSVGQTLGVGDLALYFNDTVTYTQHYRNYEILDNGPLRSTFKLLYEPQDFDGQTISMTKTITLDAGQQFNKVVVALENQNADTTPVVIGLAKRGEKDPQYDYAPNTSLAYWEPDVQGHGQTGTALLLSDQQYTFIDSINTQFLLRTEIQQGKPLVYYNGATWNKAAKITSAGAWKAFVTTQAEKVSNPLKVELR